MSEKKRVVLYGIGYNYELFRDCLARNNLEVVACVDRFKYGSDSFGYSIKPPESVKESFFDELYVLPAESNDIVDYLISMGIKSEKIKNSVDLNRMYVLNDLHRFRYVMLGDDTDYLNYPYISLCDRRDFAFRKPLSQRACNKTSDVVSQRLDRRIIFIVRDHLFLRFYETGVIWYLKKRYPNSRWVALMSDMCDGEFGRFATRGTDYLEKLKSEFELIITYHSGDASKYGLTYFNQTYPSQSNDNTKSGSKGVLFVGEAKNRLDLVHDVYLSLCNSGIPCDFWINLVQEEKQLKNSGIVYNTPLSYDQYLDRLMRCDCILEICQKGNESSYRYCEAVVYNKKLLFNDPSIFKRKYYDDLNMRFFEKKEDIDLNWVNCSTCKKYGYNDDYSPERFLMFVEERLNENN